MGNIFWNKTRVNQQAQPAAQTDNGLEVSAKLDRFFRPLSLTRKPLGSNNRRMESGTLLASVANYSLIAEGVWDTISENQSKGRDLNEFENAE